MKYKLKVQNEILTISLAKCHSVVSRGLARGRALSIIIGAYIIYGIIKRL